MNEKVHSETDVREVNEHFLNFLTGISKASPKPRRQAEVMNGRRIDSGMATQCPLCIVALKRSATS